MHTMHHRKAVTTALSSGAVLEETDVPKRRRKRPTGSSSHNGMVRNDLLIAVAFTCVLTVIAVLVVLKIYAILTRPADTTFENGRSVMAAIAAGRGNAEKEYDPADVLPWNTKYIVPGSMAVVGDRSDAYIELRQKIDAVLPLDAGRSLGAVQELLTTNTYAAAQLQPASQDDAHHNSDQVPYDIHDCPATPPQGYPFAWNMLQVLDNWGPDDTNPPASGLVYQGLCVFDYQTDYDKALTYRNAELPFVVVNDPAVAATVERWNRPGYMPSLMGGEMHRTEYSENNHFMYYVPVPKPRRRAALGSVVGNARVAAPPGWKAPTVMMRMPYAKWLQHANVTDDKLGPSNPHWYYRLIGCGGTANDGSCDKGASEYLFDELTFFQPRESLYIVEPEEQKGIHCRFGMKGVIAENHFDGSRNSIALLGGSRRYILAHPNQCEKLALYPKGHPSSRHSAVDWSEPDLKQYPQFADASVNEVVMTPGQVLYLPTEWFHYIVSLELNFQCNTRSGITKHYRQDIAQCGF